MRGTHIDRAFQMGIQLHARVAKTPGGRDKERLIDAKVPAKRGNEIVGEVQVYALRGAAHLRVDIDDTNELILLEPRQVRDRPNRRTSTARVYREYRIPDDPRVRPHLRHATVSIRHYTNAEDSKRGLNRAEVLRLVAEDHDGWGHVAQRSRAESINAQLKNRWQDKRAPAVGKNRQLLRLLFASLVNNHNAARAYETRTGTTFTGRQPPSQHHRAA